MSEGALLCFAMVDFRECFLGNMPSFMVEDAVKAHIVSLGFAAPIKVLFRVGEGEHQEEQYGIAKFLHEDDCQKLKTDGFKGRPPKNPEVKKPSSEKTRSGKTQEVKQNRKVKKRKIKNQSGCHVRV